MRISTKWVFFFKSYAKEQEGTDTKPHEINGLSPKRYNALSWTVTEYYFNCSLHNYTLLCDVVA